MTLDKYLENQEQLTGKWWIGSNKRKQYPGIIHFKEKVRLTINGNIDFDPLQRRHDEIRGRLGNGDEFLLLNNLIVASESSFIQSEGGRARSITIEPSKVIFFRHIYDNKWKSDQLERLSLDIPYIDLWLGHQLFRQDFQAHNITYDNHKEVKIKIEGHEITLGSQLDSLHSWSRNTRNQLKLKQEGYVYIQFAKILESDEAIQFYRRLEGFFRFAYMNQFLVRQFEGSIYEEKVRGRKLPRIESKEIYLNHFSNKKLVVPDYIDDLFLFTHNDLADFEAVLQKWFEIEKLLAPVYQLLLTTMEDGVYLEQRFLTLVNALEIFHRRFRNRSRKPQNDWEVQAAGILIKFTGTDRKLVKRWLKYANEVSLEERVADLVRGAGNYGFRGMMPQDIEFISSTRNTFIHDSFDATENIEKLIEASHAITELLIIAILQELGLSREAIHKISRSRYIFRYSQRQ